MEIIIYNPNTYASWLIKCCVIPVLLFLINISTVQAQFELSNSIEFGCPLLNNSSNTKVLYSQITAGLRFGLSYKPTGTQFFPTLNYSFGFTKLPIEQFGKNVVVESFNYGNLMLYGNFVFQLENNNSLYMMGGIGLSGLTHKGPGISGPNNGAMKVEIDSITDINKYFPAIGLGFEYVYGDAVNRNIYISMGFMMLYTYLYPERNIYTGTFTDNYHTINNVKASLTGAIITPSVNMTLHVLLGKNIIFWKKKDSKYL